MKKAIHFVCIASAVALLLCLLYFAFAFLGNPISYLLSKNSADRYMDTHFRGSDFRIEKVAYNLKTGGYFAKFVSPSSRDSHFTVYFDGLGRYQYDTYDAVLNKNNTFARLNEDYRELTKDALSTGALPYDISIGFGELRAKGLYEVFHYYDAAGNRIEYTLTKDYGLDQSTLELDKEYDITQLGRAHGHICLYIHDESVTTERAAKLLMEVKNHLDRKNVYFHAIEFHLCEPRNEQTQISGEQITLFEFMYSDIYEEKLTDRVQEHWDIAQEHYALQDGLINQSKKIDPYHFSAINE